MWYYWWFVYFSLWCLLSIISVIDDLLIFTHDYIYYEATSLRWKNYRWCDITLMSLTSSWWILNKHSTVDKFCSKWISHLRFCLQWDIAMRNSFCQIQSIMVYIYNTTCQHVFNLINHHFKRIYNFLWREKLKLPQLLFFFFHIIWYYAGKEEHHC